MASAKPATAPDGSARARPRPRTPCPRCRSRPPRRPGRGPGRARRPCCPRFRRTAPRRRRSRPTISAGAGQPGQPGSRPSAASASSGSQLPVGGREVAGARGVAAVGGRARAAASPSRQVSQSCGSITARGPGGGVRLVLGHPAQLGDGERGGRARCRSARPSAAGPPISAISAAACGAERMSFQSRAGRITCRPRRARPCRAAGPPPRPRRPGPAARRPPWRRASHHGSRVALGAVWMRRGRLRDDRAVIGLAEQHLGGLSGANRRQRQASAAPGSG